MAEESFYITNKKLKEIKQEYEKLKKNLSLKKMDMQYMNKDTQFIINLII